MFSRNSHKHQSSGFSVSWTSGNRRKHLKAQQQVIHHSTNKKAAHKEEKRHDVWSSFQGRKDSSVTKPELSKALLPSNGGGGSSPTPSAAAGSSSTAQLSSRAKVPPTSSSSKSASSSRPLSPSSTDFSTLEQLEQRAGEEEPEAKTAEKHSLDAHREYVSSDHTATTPITPNSSASTAPLDSPVEERGIDEVSVSISEAITMPARSHSPLPELNSAATTAEITDENRFAILGKSNLIRNDFDVFTLPSPPTSFTNSEDNLTSQSSIVATAQETPSPSPRKHQLLANGVKPNQNRNHHYNHANHSNNQVDVNSIESITEDTMTTDVKMTDLMQDEIDSHPEDSKAVSKTKRKRKKKYANVKELDQLDGVASKGTTLDQPKEEDERVVQCLYYTLMCCDCTIS